MKKLEKIKRNNNQFIIIGCFIMVFSCLFILIIIEINNYKINKINKLNIDIFFNKTEEEKQVDEINVNTTINVNKNIFYLEKYLGVLEIKKINLYRGFYKLDSYLNNINKNILLVKESDMPDVRNGNIILASHSGNSNISFFKHLNKLSENDIATIYYDNKRYDYKLINVYEVLKNGKVFIKKNSDINTLTLITCKQGTNKQLVFIFELIIGGEEK